MAKRFAGFSPLHAELLQGAEFRKADITFEKEHTLDLGGVTVRFLAMGFNHTRGDTATFVEPDKVLFSGDVAMKLLPSVGAGASLSQWIASQDRLTALAPARVVPSHGAMGDASIMADTKRFVSTVQQRAAELKKAGKTLDETVATLQAELAPAYGASPRMAGTDPRRLCPGADGDGDGGADEARPLHVPARRRQERAGLRVFRAAGQGEGLERARRRPRHRARSPASARRSPST